MSLVSSRLISPLSILICTNGYLPRVSHPIHLHGHDFWILKQEVGTYDPATTVFKTINPPRRDVATLPGNGFLAIAFQLNNPGAWLVHCHIAWHASEGLSLEFVESEGKIAGALGAAAKALIADTCDHWKASTPVFEQVDSGI
jgi:FtsP/CotA-like multicopper oxidase with cupredoxin domain